ncbi:hypothetical protein [Pedobacter jeongneungensis]|uniref:hypothetical protein n=1 Tax=Pedobacter jeongneungensis TaxID=947309 RepID=UPI0004684A19|nr:hypothetical protein [Pedobacter jeongneungensis]
MKLRIKTANPGGLKQAIIKMIKDGKLNTWTILSHDGVEYLRHTQQWGDKGVIKLTENKFAAALEVEVVKIEGVKEEVKDFEGYYFGRFCEIIFVNFKDQFTAIEKA